MSDEKEMDMKHRVKAATLAASVLTAAVLILLLPSVRAEEAELKFEERYLLPPQEIQDILIKDNENCFQ